jgi:hypothetical protein
MGLVEERNKTLKNERDEDTVVESHAGKELRPPTPLNGHAAPTGGTACTRNIGNGKEKETALVK